MCSIICLNASCNLKPIILILSFKGMFFSRGIGNVFLDCREGMKEEEEKKALCRQRVHIRP